MAEWYKEINNEFFEFTDFYEEEVAKASRELHEIIDSLNLLLLKPVP